MLRLRLQKTREPVTDFVKKHSQYSGFSFFQKIFNLKYFGSITDMAILCCVLTMTLTCCLPDADELIHRGLADSAEYKITKACDYIDDFLCFVFIFEVLIRILAQGVNFIPLFSNWFDLIVSLLGFLSFTCFDLGCNPIKISANLNVLRLLRTPRMLRLIGSARNLVLLLR